VDSAKTARALSMELDNGGAGVVARPWQGSTANRTESGSCRAVTWSHRGRVHKT